jgi:uncharacterized integral membrane protein (TIGR00697 family)
LPWDDFATLTDRRILNFADHSAKLTNINDNISDPSEKRNQALFIFLVLAGLFVSFLVACNLIFRKFFEWQPVDGIDYAFVISVGILPYPLTFLVTDLISEIFGRRRANQVVIAGLISSVAILLFIELSKVAPAWDKSPVTDEQFTHVFGQARIAIFSSMIAYLVAQFIDIRIYHFWKNLTKGRHLWLRNNFSTISSQFIDTGTVLLLLCWGGEISWDLYGALLLNGFLFKVMIAILDTPLLYLAVWGLRKKLKLLPGEEVKL